MKTKTPTGTNVKKKGKAKKILLSVFGGLAIALAAICIFSAIFNPIGNKANLEKIESLAPVENNEPLIPEKDENGYWTFTTDDDFKVLQLTDVHIGGGWLSQKKDTMAINAVAAMVTAEKPDLVIITGDVSYPVPFSSATLNNLNSAKIFAALMEKLGVYWTLGFGNHDTEAYSYYSREDLNEFYNSKNWKYCLFESGPEDIDGFGNQVINVKNSKGIITQSLFVFDSHSYTDGDIFGVMWKYDNVHENQVQWYKSTLEALNAQNDALYKELGLKTKSAIKSAAFMHIPLTEMKAAWDEYAAADYKDTDTVKLHYGVAGESGKVVYCGVGEDNLFETMVELDSTKAVFCGHDHKNNFSIEYQGIRMTYGMSVDYLAYPGIYKLGSQRGCTVITFSPDGSFDCTPENYYQDKYISAFDKEPVTMQEVTYAFVK